MRQGRRKLTLAHSVCMVSHHYNESWLHDIHHKKYEGLNLEFALFEFWETVALCGRIRSQTSRPMCSVSAINLNSENNQA